MSYNLKDKDDVQQYLTNLGIEYRFGCYSEKKSDVCHLLGDFLESVDKDFKKAAVVYKANCDDYKFPRSCYKYAAYSMLGRGVPKQDFVAAYDYFEKGCNLNNSESCLQQGLLLTATSNAKNNPIVPDVKKGMELLEKSCLEKGHHACYFLSGMYIKGVKEPKASKTDESQDKYLVARDMSKAFAFAYKGCELENVFCCANVSEMYRKGDGVEKNLELSEKYKKITMEMQEQMNSNQTLNFGQGLSN